MKATKFCIHAVIILVVLLAVSPVWAQREKVQNMPRLDADLFPPELVIRHQQEIELTEEQSRAILKASQEAQSQILEAQWALGPALQEMRAELKKTRVDEEIVLSHMRKITAKESQVKEIQLRLMIQVKNLLTPEQQDRLRPLREKRRGVRAP